jgi:hypothetical protein
MKRVLNISEALGQIETSDGPREVCVTAEASYDENNGRLIITLNSCLRTTGIRSKGEQSSAAWLPKPETVRESASPDETSELAREVFQRWVQRVRRAAPALHHPVY